MADIPGKIGKYRVEGLAGRGAMGTVYVGHDPFIDRQVAIKVCTTGEEDDPNVTRARRMFFNEAKSAGALDHPNILHIFDAGEADGQPYIVMEYVEGADALNNYTSSGSLLPVRRVVELLVQCAKALDYAHRRDVMHRDVKPANILLTRDGVVKLADFGIAQRMSPDQTLLMSTYGSPRYMSPEQARDEELTVQADIYALGVTMYELLAGAPPFAARSIVQLINQILSKTPPSLRELRPELPGPLCAIVERAMHKELSERYPTAGEMAADLARVYGDLDEAEVAPMSDEEKFSRARALKFFNEFSDDELREVLSVGKWETYARSERIIAEGAVEQSFHVIVSGDVAVSVGDVVVAVLQSGECVGELGYLSRVKRTASVMARDDVIALKIDATLMEWASLPCQMRFSKVFQQTLIDRLAQTTLELAAYKNA